MFKPYTMKDVMDASAQKKFKVISTFAGGGGSSTGYRLAGGEVLCVNEFVEEACNTYRENYPMTHIIPDDIKTLTGKDFLDATGLEVGELDILDGSPPCSAFSVSGSAFTDKGNHFDGFGKTKNYSDGKIVDNIEDLFFEFLRVADEIRPKVIIAENVKGLTIAEAKKYMNKILNTFEAIDYSVTYEILDSRYYGVAQTRARVFFVAVRNDICDNIGINFLNLHSMVYPDKLKEQLPLGDALEGLEYDEEERQWLIDQWKETSYYKMTSINMPDDPEKNLDGYDYHPTGKSHFNVKRSSRFKPAPTQTAMGNQAKTAGAVHFSEQRKLTIGELKRIMSLPDDFILTGKWNQKAERCGRMVPPLMMNRIASSVYEKILEKYNG